MNINKINSSINFNARWSKETLTLADSYDKTKGTTLRKELEEALEKNPNLKNYGGDEVILSLGSRHHYDIGTHRQLYTAHLTQEFNGYKMTAALKPVTKKYMPDCECTRQPLSENWVLREMAENEGTKKQVLDTISKTENFTAEFIDCFAEFFSRCRDLETTKKCQIFDKFFGSDNK